MEIITKPFGICVKDTDTNCPICNTELIKKVGTGRIVGNECRSCSTLGFWRSAWECYCEYTEYKYVYITCNHCLFPECSVCKVRDSREQLFISDKVYTCNKCTKSIKNREFSDKWKTMSVVDKLNVHGIEKLRILARKKAIKGRSKLNKNDLIEALIPITTHSDFPISRYISTE